MLVGRGISVGSRVRGTTGAFPTGDSDGAEATFRSGGFRYICSAIVTSLKTLGEGVALPALPVLGEDLCDGVAIAGRVLAFDLEDQKDGELVEYNRAGSTLSGFSRCT